MVWWLDKDTLLSLRLHIFRMWKREHRKAHDKFRGNFNYIQVTITYSIMTTSRIGLIGRTVLTGINLFGRGVKISWKRAVFEGCQTLITRLDAISYCHLILVRSHKSQIHRCPYTCLPVTTAVLIHALQWQPLLQSAAFPAAKKKSMQKFRS